MKLINAKMGTVVRLYYDGNRIQYTTPESMPRQIKCSTISTTIVGEYWAHNLSVPYQFILGWKQGDQPPSVAGLGLDGNYCGHPGGIFRYFGLDSYNDFIHSIYSKDYKMISTATMYKYCKLVPYNIEIHSIEDDVFGNGPIIPNVRGSMHHIKAIDIRVGDSIAWITNENKIHYCVVHDLEEGEDCAEESVIVLNGKIFCKEGMRSFPKGYPMGPDQDVLLISRVG